MTPAANVPWRWAFVLCAVLAYAWTAWQRRWMTDDGYINIRVVQQLLDGNGPVFNAGERVEVTTSTLWFWMIAGPSAVLRGIEPSVIAVVLGWALAVLAMVFAVLGARQLALAAGPLRSSRAAETIPIPLGLLIVLAIPQFSDFATSGLEGSLTFCNLAVCFFGLARHLHSGAPAHRPLWLPVVIGLGYLVRPDVALYSVAFGVALLVVSRRSWFGAIAAIVLAAIIPAGYQLFRMGYFATVVPNTALAKGAGSVHWEFGLNYLHEFVAHYAMVIPALVAAAVLLVVVVRMRGPVAWRARVIALVPVAAGLVHLVYITRVGGDFMFGRFLLPPTFAMLLPLAVVFVAPPALRRGFGLALTTVVVWALYAGAAVQAQKFYGHGVQDERLIYTSWTPSGTTIRPADWAGFSFYENGYDIASEYAAGERFFQEDNGVRYPVKKGFELVHTHNVMGIVSVTAGTGVTIVDNLALADPLAARMAPDPDQPVKRMGHVAHPSSWRVARYAEPSAQDTDEDRAARAALKCQPLKTLTHGITAPMTPRLFASNVKHSVANSLLVIDRDPVVARQQLCAAKPKGH